MEALPGKYPRRGELGQVGYGGGTSKSRCFVSLNCTSKIVEPRTGQPKLQTSYNSMINLSLFAQCDDDIAFRFMQTLHLTP